MTIVLTSLTLFMTGCQRDPLPEEPKVEVALNSQIATKASDAKWEAEDLIGLFMLEADEWNISGGVDNFQYESGTPETDGSSSFSPVDGDNTAYFPINGDEVDFLAYYPYNSSVSSFVYPISLSDQSSLPAIDLMTAKSDGYDKLNPEVSLNFTHRLVKLRFVLSSSVVTAEDIEGAELTIKGMYTTASYNLSTGAISSQGNKAGITIDLSDEGICEAIVLPRAAGEGVTFEIELVDGTVFTAIMSSSQVLTAGTKNTFRISLQANPVTVSATITDWTSTTAIDLTSSVVISNPPGTTSGFKTNDEVLLYKSNTLGHSALYKYSSGSWTSTSPLEWNVIGSPVDLYAWTPVLKSSGSPILPDSNGDLTISTTNSSTDILLSNNIKNLTTTSPANLTFTHAFSQVAITVIAGSNVTQSAVESATVSITGVNKSAKLRVTNKAISTLSNKGSVSTTSATGSNVYTAIVLPQSISANTGFVSIVAGSVTYTCKTGSSGITFEAGKKYNLSITINSSSVELSATVVDWVVENYNFNVE